MQAAFASSCLHGSRTNEYFNIVTTMHIMVNKEAQGRHVTWVDRIDKNVQRMTRTDTIATRLEYSVATVSQEYRTSFYVQKIAFAQYLTLKVLFSMEKKPNTFLQTQFAIFLQIVNQKKLAKDYSL